MKAISKVYKHEHQPDDVSAANPDYIEKLTSRDMTIVNEKEYSERVLEDEASQESDEAEDWAQQDQSPLTGRISGSMEELERFQSSELMASDEVRQCLKDSLYCYQTCTETTLRCVSMGGDHAKHGPINLLMDCARICNTNAEFIMRNSTYYPQTCGICADICDECGDECDKFEEDFMKECASACRRCAESCREMAR
ncbi:MAG TPA: four-helix bundle copper-binding protein [Candidatus Acidoferrales bacterium]|nr:four-helix bundle copper-binding protein [Candidatus Acidoferrales bacterium]